VKRSWIQLSVLLPLLGAGCQDYEVNRSRVFDTFRQAERDAELDVLWVLDNSSSTLEEQEQLAETTGAFIEFMSFAGTAYQIGVVTTDMATSDAGRLRGGLILDESTPDIEDEFSALVLVDDDGSTTERGMDAMVAALEPGGPNPDFAREGADLEVIIFTDEDDSSRLEPDEALDDLEDFRGDNAVGVTAIIGDLPEGCATLLAAADPGYRYAELVELSRGRIESICTSDYESMMQRVALEALGLINTFQLSRVPDLTSLEVRVDGALLYQRETNGWTYDPGSNAVIFDGYAMPPPGSIVDVEYYEWYGLGAPEETEAESE